MSEETNLASELIGSGFTGDKHKRGLLRWFIGFSMSLNVLLVYYIIDGNREDRKQSIKHEEILHQIIKMQNETKHRVDTTIQKL